MTPSTLQYADDTLIICKASSQDVALIKRILDDFSSATGLEINYSKSTMVCIHVPPEDQVQLANVLGCRLENFPQTYLGLLLSTTKLNFDAFAPVISRVDRFLASWQASLLNYADRIILINAILSSLPTYAMAAMELPKGVFAAIDKRRRAFLWTGDDSCSGSKCLPRLTAAASQDLAHLSTLLQNFQLSAEQDSRSLTFQTNQNTFSCSKLYGILNSRPTCCSNWKFVWKNKAPPRVQFFAWLLAKDRLPMRVNLKKKNITPSDVCEICKIAPETAEHLFLHCSVAKAFWDLTHANPNIPSMKALNLIQPPSCIPSEQYKCFYLLCFWRIWKHRNEVVFQNLLPCTTRLLKACKEESSTWSFRLNDSARSSTDAWRNIFTSALLPSLSAAS
ncbi:hypothetical protein OsJ_25400 [Oryza sativa Japonica Group]|uniref:Reverse transcriptase domain-containing protein n=1 Tax=Oryza sativa subsp. japonica TaxID=39947 RepID=B9FUL3_ORYSJ|nr:hypothetical protein OsJ_25400 [Oryza sativa Japonica Group]